MKHFFECTLSIFLIIFASISIPAFAVSPDAKETKRVLVVHSYHPGYAWTDAVMNGVRDVLDKQNGLEVFAEYLDTKRYVGTAYFQQIKQSFQYKYKNKGIDVIIISDDEAFDLVLETREEYFPNVPIVVCGLNQRLKIISNINSAYAVKGGHEGIKSTIDLILSLHPDVETVFFVSDISKTGKSKLETVRQLQPAYKEKVGFEYLSGLSMGELQTALKKLPEKSVVFNLAFIRDSSGKVFSIKDSSQMIGNSARVPVYCSWGFQPGTSVMGGHVNTGFSHGERSAQIAVKLLNNEEKLKIPSIQEVERLYMFDYKVMKRFNIGIKDIPENSVVYNKPFSIYEEYRWYIIGVIIFMVAQTLIVVSLLIIQKKRKRAEGALLESENRFRSIVENADAGYFFIDQDGLIQRVNESWLKMYGYSSAGEIIGKHFTIIQKADAVEAAKEFVNGIMRGDPQHMAGEFSRKCKDDSIGYHTFSARPVFHFGEVTGIEGFIIDITERKQADDTLRESEQRFRLVFEKHNAVMLLINPNSGQIENANLSAERFYGYPIKTLCKLNIADLNILSPTKIALERQKALTEERSYFEFPHRLASGKVRTVEVHSSPVKIGEQQLLFSIIHDITDRKQAKEALRESEQKYRTLFESSRDAIMTLAPPTWLFTSGNPATLELFKVKDEAEFISLGPWQLSPERQPDGKPSFEKAKEMIETAMRRGSHFFEWRHKRLDGEDFPATVLITRFESVGQVLLQATVRDITERKQAEELIRASLKEKEILLSEIHHRVKNNMQVIISLLKLQADKIEDKRLVNMLKESQDRIRSMAFVHEQLYQAEDFASIDFGEYVKSFVNGLFVSNGVDTNKVKLNIDIQDVFFDLENAIPCGLIINELVSNSLKHAFSRQGEGNISIVLRAANEDELELTVSDDGVGIPEDLDIRNTESMGLHLVRVLSEQTLEGKMELNRTEGNRFHFQLKRSKYKPRI